MLLTAGELLKGWYYLIVWSQLESTWIVVLMPIIFEVLDIGFYYSNNSKRGSTKIGKKE